MNQDLALTAEGTPAIVVGKERYPLVITISGMKAWAEHLGRTFEQVLKDGWNLAELTEDDMKFLLKLALQGGERRRVLFDGGVPKEITDELASSIVELCHLSELVGLLATIWNEPPVRTPDPQNRESPPAGG